MRPRLVDVGQTQHGDHLSSIPAPNQRRTASSSPSSCRTVLGGWRTSGVGKEGGRQGFEEFLRTKSVSIGLGGAFAEGARQKA
ncbi:hypothetical protein AB0B60_42805 [Streptomyces lincolnensis]|uniref:hypothetical protein n=1 Tax=Streptomyces lincolnensis TaxID=1915 RepID=UPI0008339A0B|nr:hypothetical protein [Streptomyces lincolnensis]